MHKIKRDPCPDERTGGTLCNALDEYVWKIDENYSYELIQTNTDFRRVTAYSFKMTSQKWLNETYWEHTKGAVSKLSIGRLQTWLQIESFDLTGQNRHQGKSNF